MEVDIVGDMVATKVFLDQTFLRQSLPRLAHLLNFASLLLPSVLPTANVPSLNLSSIIFGCNFMTFCITAVVTCYFQAKIKLCLKRLQLESGRRSWVMPFWRQTTLCFKQFTKCCSVLHFSVLQCSRQLCLCNCSLSVARTSHPATSALTARQLASTTSLTLLNFLLIRRTSGVCFYSSCNVLYASDVFAIFCFTIWFLCNSRTDYLSAPEGPHIGRPSLLAHDAESSI